MNKSQTAGAMLIILGASLWGTLGFLGEFLFTAGLSALDVVTMRVLLAWCGFACLTLMARHEIPQVRAKDFGLFALYGMISVALYNILYFEALARVGISISVALLYTAPLWAVFLSRVFLHEQITFVSVIAAAMGISGVAMIVGVYPYHSLSVSKSGFMFGLGAGLSYALFSIFGKRALYCHDRITVLLYAFGFGILFLLPCFSLEGGWARLAHLDFLHWTLLGIIGLFPTFMAYLLYIQGLRRVSASSASLLATAEPVVAVTIAYFGTREHLTLWQALGIALIIISALAVLSRSLFQPEGLPGMARLGRLE